MILLINGEAREVENAGGETLVWVLRDELGLTGTKANCGIGVCGVCTVHVDGEPRRACITPLDGLEGRAITTIEGLAQGGELHPVQRAFLEQQVPQCAYCMSGQMMTAAAFLARTPNPSPEAIADAMSANYCRCGCYGRIRAAVAEAARLLERA